MTNEEGINAGRSELCELCCEELAGKAVDDLGRIDWSCTNSQCFSVVTQFLLMALRFIGMLIFFSVAIWFFPHRESAAQKKQRLLDEAWEKKQSALEEWKRIQWAEFVDRRNIHDFRDRELQQELEYVKQLDDDEKSFHDEVIFEIRRMEALKEIPHTQSLDLQADTTNVFNLERQRLADLENIANEAEEQQRHEDIYQHNLRLDVCLDRLFELEQDAIGSATKAQRYR